MAVTDTIGSSRPARTVIGPPGQAAAPLSDIQLGFRSGYVFELRDVRSPIPIQVHVLALNPQSYTLSEPFQLTLTPTEDDSVVAEENGLIVREISIAGTMGMKVKRGPAFQGDQGLLTGNEHFLALRKLFRDYSTRKKGRDGVFIRLIFHSLRDDDHFVVVPRSFETPRDARTTRMHYEYRISMAVIGEADDAGLVSIIEKSDFFSDVEDAVAAISAAFNDARSYFAEATAVLSEIKRKVGNIHAVMIQAAGMLNAVGNFLRGTRELIDFPLQLGASVVENLDRAADRLAESYASLDQNKIAEEGSRNIRRMSAAIDRILNIPDKFGPSSIDRITAMYDGEKNLTSADIVNQTAGATLGSKARLAAGSAKDAGLDLGDFRGIRKETVARTTTIESLAASFDVPQELIILINDLTFPYVSEAGGPGLLKPGDPVLIPVREGLSSEAVQPSGEYLTADEALYGIDLALDPVALKEGNFEIKEDTTRSLHDAQLVSGINNVIQGTELTIRTERGTTVFIPDLGIRRAVGTKGTIQHMLLAALNLREAILSDPRIEGIQESKIVLDGDVLSQEITPLVVGQKEGVTLVLPFGSASGVGG